jgi:hypothetical protein
LLGASPSGLPLLCSFLPGILSSLFRVLQHPNSGTNVFILALQCLTSVIISCINDSIVHVIEQTENEKQQTQTKQIENG